MLIKAEQKNIRISARKIRLMARTIAKLRPKESLDFLKFINKSGAKDLAKTIKQAIANAVKNKKLKEENLIFSKIEILDGSIYKRWRLVSKGRAHDVKKRTCHIKIILETVDKK